MHGLINNEYTQIDVLNKRNDCKALQRKIYPQPVGYANWYSCRRRNTFFAAKLIT